MCVKSKAKLCSHVSVKINFKDSSNLCCITFLSWMRSGIAFQLITLAQKTDCERTAAHTAHQDYTFNRVSGLKTLEVSDKFVHPPMKKDVQL